MSFMSRDRRPVDLINPQKTVAIIREQAGLRVSVPSDSEMTADRMQELRRRVTAQALTICPAEKPPRLKAEPERGGSFEETVAAWRWLADRARGEPVGKASLHDRLRTLAWRSPRTTRSAQRAVQAASLRAEAPARPQSTQTRRGTRSKPMAAVLTVARNVNRAERPRARTPGRHIRNARGHASRAVSGDSEHAAGEPPSRPSPSRTRPRRPRAACHRDSIARPHG